MSIACFNSATDCVLDWDGISAVATAVAIVIALASAGLAAWIPRWIKRTDRSDTTHEILSSAGKAIDLFRLAESRMGFAVQRMSEVIGYGAKAAYTRVALERLSARAELTDGAIFVAAGAIELLNAVEKEVAKYKTSEEFGGTQEDWENLSATRDRKFARKILSDLPNFVALEPIILERAKEVATSAMQSKWPKSQERFASIAANGLRPRVAAEAPR
ncbi:hypothetical protein [Sphingomonas sp. NFX23]|uniref:hypothetical protein n=1 Tax=Sphingomonas sp. NFX23 TaxID=2819532 RepID=UPI003CF3F5FC